MKKIKLPIKNIETNIILNALIQFKNDKLKHIYRAYWWTNFKIK